MISKTQHSASILAIAAGLFVAPSAANAQVAPTEVNEEAVDEFGLDRKTGRFTWSTGEIIGIGGEGARIGVSVNGIRSPANATTVMPSVGHAVQTGGPRLTIAPMPADFPLFPGEIDPNKNYVTVDYSGGSHTFECTLSSCAPQYIHWFKLLPQGNGYLFKDIQGVEILFTASKSVTTYPDGRVEEQWANGTRKNNLGYLVKVSGANIQAVNQSIDYCDETSTSACPSPSKSRTATLPTGFANPLHITNAAGDVTKLRWESKTARELRPAAGDPLPASQVGMNRTITARYPLGITLPGSTSEDITITYGSHDPQRDTHDDIRVSSISKNGILANYDITDYWPFGKDRETEAPPPEGGTLAGTWSGSYSNSHLMGDHVVAYTDPLTGESGLQTIPAFCSPVGSIQPWDINGGNGGSMPLLQCDPYTGGGVVGSGSGGGSTPSYSIETAPPDEDDPAFGLPSGTSMYYLTIKATVDGVVVSESQSLKPYMHRGMARRRLLYVKDGLDRVTEYVANPYDEVGMVVQPEGNTIGSGYDWRGNVITSFQIPKPGTNTTELFTSLTYAADCDPTPLPRCNKPLTVTDANGNVTEYTYNDRGQVLTETKPAPTPNAPRPKVTNTYTMRTAYIKNASGNPVAAGPAISLLTRSSSCMTQSSCVGTTDEVVTEYDYGPATGLNNLQLRGVAVTAANELGQMETRRTCYQYNYFGEKIAETQPRAGLTTCP